MGYDDYKSAALQWKRACDSAEKPSDMAQLCENVARELARPFQEDAFQKLHSRISKSGFDLEKDLRPLVDSLKKKRAALDEERRQQEEERERMRLQEKENREARIKKLREQRLKEEREQKEAERKLAERIREKLRLEEKRKAKEEQERRIREETRRRHEKEIAELIRRIESSAARGVFHTDVPSHLETAMVGAYDRALLCGTRVYLNGIIQRGDLPNYDRISETLPACLQMLSKEIKARYVSGAIGHATGICLDAEQLEAVIADESVMKVTARAGSGKTRVLVAKAFYLIKFYNVNPSSILLLAFNRNAARELQDRLKSFLNLDAFHTARTFHSLAYQIAKPDSDLVMSDVDPTRDQVGKIIQKILLGIWKGEFAKSIYTFFRNEAREYEGLGLHLKGKKFYDFRRSLPQATLRGDHVRSLGEKYIADYLFEHGIGYKYEPSFRMGSVGVYRPDFEVWSGEGATKRKFVWEHWALDPNAFQTKPIDGWTSQEIQQYREDISRKRDYWNEKGWVLIETHADMLGRGRNCFEDEVRQILKQHGITNEKLPQAELLKRIETTLRSRLSRLLSQFVNRALCSEPNIDLMLTRIREYQAADEREKFFLKLGADVLCKYLDYLNEHGLMDFALFFSEARDVLHETGAVPLIHASGGNMIDLNSLSYIFVDEAQDMSPNYLLLLQSLSQVLPKVKLMFVGDDWQAINRFAGADVNLFIDLSKQYNDATQYALKNNYRSRRTIVEAGNKLMSGNPIEHSKAKKLEEAIIQSIDLDAVWLELRKGEDFEAERQFDQKFLWGRDPSERQKNDAGGEKARLVKVIFNVCKPIVQGDEKIAVLFRSNKFKGSFIDSIRDKVLNCFYLDGYPRNQVDSLSNRLEFSTAHRSKGKEYDTVCIVSPHEGAFPMVHGDIQLYGFFGESYEQAMEDEMRLFYVAITRSEKRLIFLKEGSKNTESPFLEDLEGLIQNVKLRRYSP